MSNRCIAAALAVVLGSLITACSAGETRSGVSTGTSTSAAATTAPSGAVTVPTESGGVTVPAAAATGGTTSSGSGTTGPGEKENQRGNTPPGTSRDGAGPAGGAILDPSGAAKR